MVLTPALNTKTYDTARTLMFKMFDSYKNIAECNNSEALGYADELAKRAIDDASDAYKSYSDEQLRIKYTKASAKAKQAEVIIKLLTKDIDNLISDILLQLKNEYEEEVAKLLQSKNKQD